MGHSVSGRLFGMWWPLILRLLSRTVAMRWFSGRTSPWWCIDSTICRLPWDRWCRWPRPGSGPSAESLAADGCCMGRSRSLLPCAWACPWTFSGAAVFSSVGTLCRCWCECHGHAVKGSGFYRRQAACCDRNKCGGWGRRYAGFLRCGVRAWNGSACNRCCGLLPRPGTGSWADAGSGVYVWRLVVVWVWREDVNRFF